MSEVTTNKATVQSDEISIKDIIVKVRSGFKYLKSKWLTILICSVVGGLIGLGYAMIKKPVYTATCTFVLDEGSKGGSLGQYAGLASLAGIDIGGGGTNGLFQGDNIIELYKSRIMIETALLSEADFNGKTEKLIDRYINFNELRDLWKKKDHIENINFNGDPQKFNRKQDSIITNLVELFNKRILAVSKPDKKLSLIRVDAASTDELFAKIFVEQLVETVNNFYIQAKTKKASRNVMLLEKEADSVRRVLNSSISGVASAIDASPNANPALQVLRVPSQRRQVDVQASAAIYGEVVKNLEISKMTLRQETPLIQVIDQPVLPLSKDKLGKLKGLIIGSILVAFFTIFFLIAKKIYNSFI
jgi:hypothetical protein